MVSGGGCMGMGEWLVWCLSPVIVVVIGWVMV
jgi:hypothetical protein